MFASLDTSRNTRLTADQCPWLGKKILGLFSSARSQEQREIDDIIFLPPNFSSARLSKAHSLRFARGSSAETADGRWNFFRKADTRRRLTEKRTANPEGCP